jgi:excinuclease ABC subunit A
VWKDRTTVCRHDFSKRFEVDGITFLEPSEAMFNFNNPDGA